jgi:hypothetical protein
VRLSIDDYGSSEGGAYFAGDYESVGEAILAVEDYLQEPVSRWVNITRADAYPDPPSDGATVTSIASLLSSGDFVVPKGAVFEINKGYYERFWKARA